MDSVESKYITRSLELRSLCSWFKRFPSKCASISFNDSFKNNLYISGNYPFKADEFSTYTDTICHQQQHVKFYTKFLQRSTFEAWKIYVIYKLHNRNALCTASYFYRKKLQKNVFIALLRNVLLEKRIPSGIISKFNKKASLTDLLNLKNYPIRAKQKRYFKQWLEYSHIKRMKRNVAVKVQRFCVVSLLKKTLAAWKTFVLLNKQKTFSNKELMNKACTFYNTKLLKKYLTIWTKIHSSNLHLKNCFEEMFIYYKRKLLQKCMIKWRKYYVLRMQKQYLHEKAHQQYYKKLLEKCLKKLVLYVQEVNVTERLMQSAVTFYQSKLLVKLFIVWKKWYYQILNNSFILQKIQSKIQSKLEKKVLHNWTLYVFYKKCKRRNMFLSINMYHKKIITDAFKKFRTYVIYKREKQTQLLHLNAKKSCIIQIIQQICLNKWKKALSISMQKKQQIFKIIEFYNSHIFKRYFYYWKLYNKQHKLEVLYKDELKKRAECFILNKCIFIWQTKCNHINKSYEKENIIIFKLSRKIEQKYLIVWKSYVSKRKEKRREFEYAKGINKKLLLYEGLKEILRNSLTSIQVQYENRLENITKRSMDHFEILNKFFNKWMSIIHVKKRRPSCLKTNYHCSYATPIDIGRTDETEQMYLTLPEYMKQNDELNENYNIFDALHYKPYNIVFPETQLPEFTTEPYSRDCMKSNDLKFVTSVTCPFIKSEGKTRLPPTDLNFNPYYIL